MTRPAETPRTSEAVLAFGEALVDELPNGSAVGGAPLNVACHLVSLGHPALLVTRVGKDAAGERVLRFLAERNVSLEGIQRDGVRPTGRVIVGLEAGQPSFEILPDRAFDAIEPEAAERVARRASPAIVYFGTLAQRRMRSRMALRRLLRSCGGRRFLDVNLRPPWVDATALTASLRHTDVLKLNESELEALAARVGVSRDGDPEAAARAVLSRYRIGAAIVTRGEAGALAVERSETGWSTWSTSGGPLGSALVDTVGAGDGFAAIAILGILRGWPATVTLQRADDFARALCAIPGAVPEDPAFYDAFRTSWRLEAA